MWDRPRDLNAISNLLFALVIACVLYAAMYRIIHLPYFDLKTVRVDGMTGHVSRDQVAFIAGRRLKGNFFTVNLDGLKDDFGKLPWVRNVSVRRRWPLEIDVKIEEHVPLAHWGVDQFVDTYGDVFDASTDAKLPQFSGPFGSSQEVAAEYSAFSKSLAPLGKHVDQISVSARRAWEIRLDDGMVVKLGREHVEERLADFAALYGRTVGQLAKRIDYVDLRYDNGFAVRIPGQGTRAGA